MRYLYKVLIYLAAPVALLIQLWRGLRDRSYRERLGERLGLGAALAQDSIWVHAVSVGEVQAAGPLVRTLRERYPAVPLVLTTVTPTGAERARMLFGADVVLRYVPLDLPGSVRRFFVRVRPRVALIMETELWPNLYAECGRRSVPLVLASARISPRSVSRYRRLVPLFRDALSHGVVIAAQSADDAQRFLSIGANPARTQVIGNIKFEFELRPDVERQGRAWRSAQAADRLVWVAGSTHEGEEDILLDAHERLCRDHPQALLVLVPRHPNRFEAVASLLARRGVSWVSRAAGQPLTPEKQVLLGDTMGELMMLYAAADVAFVAGSLQPVGGHNLLEPAALGVPILTGPHNFNGEDVFRKMREAGAVRVVTDAETLAEALLALLADAGARRGMGEKGFAVVRENRGALDRLIRLVTPLVDSGRASRDAAP